MKPWHIRWQWLSYLGAICGLATLAMGGCLEQSTPPKSVEHGKIQQSVIGGKPDLRYPAVGGLIEAGHTFCTATLIASKVVLTAAHCVDGKGPGNKINFRIDVPSQSSASGYQSHFYELDSTRLAPHPKWTGSLTNGYDVAIVLLRTAVPANIATPLPFNTMALDKSWEGKAPLFMGFGLIASDPTAISPDTKHAVAVPIIRVRGDVFLTYGNKVSTCHGDSGGPALAVAGGRFSVIGVNSYSQSARVPGSNPPRTKCDGQNGIARVDVHARFIQSYLDQYGDAPGSCQTSTDCGNCDACTTTSGSKQCERRPALRAPTSCKPCTTNADCGGGICHRFDEGFRCIHRCPGNGCCPSQTKCLEFQTGGQEDWFCVPDQTKCPPVTCTTDKDCGPGELCKTGTCTPQRPPRSAKLCHPCTKNEDCPGDDAFCIGPKGSGYCSQTCGSADFCPTGTACQQPYRGTPKQCLAAGGSCTIPCTEDKDCPTDFACKDSACARKTGGIAGDFCSTTQPCQTGLDCTKTLDGTRCLQSCGVPLGEAGSLCKEGLQCNGKASCYSVPGRDSSCIQPCDADSVCNGGPCFNNVCKCTDDKDCYEGFFCNKSAGLFPTCIAKKLDRPCTAGFVCKAFGPTKFCVADTGSVAIGQPCDAFHRCRPGLACTEGKDGARCLEDCTRTRGCTLGGQCAAPKDGVAVCVCKAGQCPNGSRCSPAFYLDEFGYCESTSTTPNCTSRLECPAGYTCTAGTCVVAPPAPEVVEEPPPEPTPEPPPADEPPPPRPEPVVPDEPAPQPEPIVPDEPAPDAASTEPAPDIVPEAAKKGCGCDSTGSTPPWPGLLLLLFVIAATSWRQNTCELNQSKNTHTPKIG